MQKLAFIPMALVALMLVSGARHEANAQWFLAPHGGANFDAEEIYFGVDARIPIRQALINGAAIEVNPGFDYYPFIGSDGVSASYWMLNLDAVYPFPMHGVQPYVGSGLFISRISAEALGVTVSNTDVGVNFKGGALFGPAGAPRPYGELVFGVGGESAVGLRGGVQFPIGR